MRGDVEEIVVSCGHLFDHLLDGFGSWFIWCGEQDAGWYLIRSESAVGEVVQIVAAFSHDPGQAFGILVDFEPPTVDVGCGSQSEISIRLEVATVPGGLPAGRFDSERG